MWKELICKIFGHQTKDANSIIEIIKGRANMPPETFSGYLVICDRCDGYHPINSFRVVKELKNNELKGL